jgi:hypothetical protein
VAGENTGLNSRASLWMNSELTREENVFSKWSKQGAQYNESTGSIICSEIEKKDME